MFLSNNATFAQRTNQQRLQQPTALVPHSASQERPTKLQIPEPALPQFAAPPVFPSFQEFQNGKASAIFYGDFNCDDEPEEDEEVSQKDL